MTIAQDITEKLQGVAEITREKVIEHFAEREADKRARALIDGLDQLDKLDKDLRRSKPDVVAYADDGTEVSANWSKPALEARKKLTEQRDKLERAITKADEKAEYGDLYGIVNKGGKEKAEE